jgi:predicted enzyme related to lactoylglutathione lyase
MARLVALHAGGQRSPWQSIGLTCDDATCLLSDVLLLFSGNDAGLTGWTISSDKDDVVSVDGIPTTLVSQFPSHPIQSTIGSQRIVGLDHVVVNTDDIDRTCSAITEVLGVEVRRERQLGNGAVQRFHKLENTIIEVVSGPHVTTPGASLWGMVVSVDDLFDYCEEVGDAVTSPPKKATQPGRYISTVRSSVGLNIPFALMTPHVSGMDTR